VHLLLIFDLGFVCFVDFLQNRGFHRYQNLNHDNPGCHPYLYPEVVEGFYQLLLSQIFHHYPSRYQGDLVARLCRYPLVCQDYRLFQSYQEFHHHHYRLQLAYFGFAGFYPDCFARPGFDLAYSDPDFAGFDPGFDFSDLLIIS
jgi:hypothetical protein